MRSISDETADLPTTAFALEYAAALREWGRSLERTDGPVIAISRKAPRLIELGLREHLIPDSLVDRVTSERGLGPISTGPVDSQSVCVCDDIVIVGSTFHRITNIAEQVCGPGSVKPTPFAISSRAEKENLIGLTNSAPLNLPSDLCSSFILSEVAAFGSLNKPYDIEHPILYLDLQPGLSVTEVERLLLDFGAQEHMRFYSTPRQFAAADGSIRTAHAWSLLSRDATPHSETISKLRCYFDEKAHRLAIVPIQPEAGTVGDFKERIASLPEVLQELSSAISSDVSGGGTDLLHTTRQRSFVAWANYLLELNALLPTIWKLRNAFERKQAVLSNRAASLSLFDVQLLTGPALAKRTRAKLERFVNSAMYVHEVRPLSAAHDFTAPIIPEEYLSEYESALAELLEGCETAEEVLSAVFKAQHVAIEVKSRNYAASNPKRLEFGVPFAYLTTVLENALGLGDAVEVHRAMDRLIDSGVIVPRYLKSRRDGAEYWFRSFRVGEAQANVCEHVTKECFKALSSVFGKSDLGEILTEKFFVLACDLNEIFKGSSLAASLNIRRGFHLYGARPKIAAGGNDEWLVEWAARRRVLRRNKRERDVLYALDKRAEKYLPDAESPLTVDARHQVAALARWVRAVYQDNRLGADFLVAVTTVESEVAHRLALEAEITGWIHHRHWGIVPALQVIEDLTDDRTQRGTREAATILRNLANWVAQANVKNSLRERFTKLMTQADELWPGSSYEDVAATWNSIIKPRLIARQSDRSSPPTIIADTLMPVLRVLGRVTSLLRNVLSQLGGVADERAVPIAQSVDELISTVQALPKHLRDKFVTAISGVEALAASVTLDQALPVAHKAATAVADAADWALSIHRSYSSEQFDDLRTGIFLLFWDVRGSTNNETRGALTRRIMEVNEAVKNSFGHKLLEFDPESSDDGNIAVCEDFPTAISVAELVAKSFMPDYAVKMGCGTNFDGTLFRSRSTRRLGGRAYEYAARLMGFFKEIETETDGAWLADSGSSTADLPAQPKGSYVVLSEEAFRVAKDSGFFTELTGFTELPGGYRPRVFGAYRRRVYVCELGEAPAPVQMPLLDSTGTD